MGAPHVHVYWGLLQAAAEEAWLRDDGDAGEPLLPDAVPALHRRVAVPGPQRPVVGGRCAEVLGVDVDRGVGRAQGCVPPVRQRMAQLCLLRDCAERPHCGGPQVEVAVVTGDHELGVAGNSGCVLQDSVLGRRAVRPVHPPCAGRRCGGRLPGQTKTGARCVALARAGRPEAIAGASG